MREIIKQVFGERIFKKGSLAFRWILNTKLVKFGLLFFNFNVDFIKYVKHSNLFGLNSFEKIEAIIILKYHSIEKGLLNSKIRYRFGEKNIKVLSNLLKKDEIITKKNNSQINAAYITICNYYNLHSENNIDISDYFSEGDYNFFLSCSSSMSQSIVKHDDKSYFNNTYNDFFNFSNSRSSVRDYTGEKIQIHKIRKVIELASNAPSVCNRQPVKVYHLDNREKIEKIFQIQQGLTGYSNSISQLLIVSVDRNYFYTVGERNQLYIDGGIFLMNLLYSLHYYNIASCPAHWGLEFLADKRIQEITGMKESEKVISLVAIGVPKNNFKTCKSKRRLADEILTLV